MSYQLRVIKDYPIGFWPLDESSGTAASDISGCSNNATYNGSVVTTKNPLIPGGIRGTYITNVKTVSFPIVNDYYGSTSSGSLADKNSLDNDFSFEIWFHPEFQTTSLTPIFADNVNGIGLFYENGDILFKMGAKSIRYTLPYVSKSHYIVGTYTGETINLYYDGAFVSSLAISQSELGLTNTGLTLKCGPTVNSSDSFIVDAPAVYRYALNTQQILSHFIDSKSIQPIQVVYPDEGILFPLSDQNLKIHYNYSYPFSKDWSNFATEDTIYDSKEQSLSLIANSAGGSKTVTFTDYIVVPTQIGLATSKVEWSGTNGITVQTSLDGITYTTCVNGQAVPQYKQSSFSTSGKLFIKFILSTSDLSKSIPKLKYINFAFYKTKDLYAYNSGEVVSYSQLEYHLGEKNYPILSHDYRNGLRCSANGGFRIATTASVSTVEMFYTPTGFTDSALVSSALTGSFAASNYSWRSTRAVSKTNISAIYVNGVDKTSETDIANVFKLNEFHHVVIVYTAPISDVLTFNYSSFGSTASLFQNVAIYSAAFDSAKALEHYDLYMSRPIEILDDSSLTLTESAPEVYDNDWLVVQGV